MTNEPLKATQPLPCPWKPGDKVQRKPGASYLFPGVVISVGLKLDGKTWHCEVECIAPGVEGCTHVFPVSQLVPLDPAWNTRADSHHRLVEALEDARTALSITRTNVMTEIGRCSDESRSPWAGVPEQLAKRIAKIDAALKEAGR